MRVDAARLAALVAAARVIVLFGPWVLDHGTRAKGAGLLVEQPLSIRVLHRLAVRPRSQRLARPLRRDHESVHARTER